MPRGELREGRLRDLDDRTKQAIVRRLAIQGGLDTWMAPAVDGDAVEMDVIGYGSGDLSIVYDNSREWAISWAEYTPGPTARSQPGVSVTLDVPLQAMSICHEDILHRNEIHPVSLEKHADGRCVIVGVVGDIEPLVQVGFEEPAVDTGRCGPFQHGG